MIWGPYSHTDTRPPRPSKKARGRMQQTPAHRRKKTRR